MSQTERKRGPIGEVLSFANPEKRLAETFERAKEIIEEHPAIAALTAAAGAVLLYEKVYRPWHEERTGEKLSANPLDAIGVVYNRAKTDPEGLKEEAHGLLTYAESYIRAHRKIMLGIITLGPILLEHFFPRSKVQKPDTLTPTAPIRRS